MKIRFFLLLSLTLLLFSLSYSSSFAQEILSSSTSASPTPTAAKVDYELPYPGLLPDNPLYMLKALRDRIIQFLISDPVKKSEFFLLSSDKRFNVGNYLIIKGKKDMGVLYISKSNNYMHMAIISAKESRERGNTITDRITTSIQKHEEVLGNLISRVDKKNRSELNDELKRLKDFETLINKK